MQAIQMPTNLDSLPELGRTLTDETLFVHYANGVMLQQDRRSGRYLAFQLAADLLADITNQYAARGNFIRF
jgi:hypothetical protein